MDGTEQVIFESTETKEFSGFIFLDKMEVGDTITVKEYVKDEEDSTYKLYESWSYTNVQTKSAIRVAPIIGKVGLKITLQQTAGTYRVITHHWFGR